MTATILTVGQYSQNAWITFLKVAFARRASIKMDEMCLVSS
jgi:hypothetical protein